jgi:two-component system, NarL family, nitrate/nitrite response regulator NarL
VTARLTPRERRLIHALLAGSTNREIARRLGLQEQTVKNQLSVIYNKLGVRNRLELAVLANRDGLLERETDD